MDHSAIVLGCQDGDAHAQRALYTLFAGKMMGVSLRYAGSREEAQDILQDGFVKVFTNIHKFEAKGSLEGWIRRIIVNTALEALRKKDALRYSSELEHHESLMAQVPNAEDALAEQELMTLVQSLPTGFRTVFNLYAIEGYSHKEIAEMLNISAGTSKSQYARARAVLQRALTNTTIRP